MYRTHHPGWPLAVLPCAAGLFACCAPSVHAQTATATATLPALTVEGARSVADSNNLPVTTESVTAAQIEDTINAMTVEDTLKYLPSISIRQRYIGDTQAPMATRTTGINASARSLIYVDGILLSALINNNNGNGSPQWFMVSPEEIARIDVMYGPFAAMYPGNSYGAVTAITTRMPTAFEASAKLSTSSQHFNQYGEEGDYGATQASVSLGNRVGRLSWRFSANHLDSFSQPVTYLTVKQSGTAAGGLPAVTGAVAGHDRTGAPIEILGAGNLTHTVQDSARLKLAYDLTPTLTAGYTLGYWQNRAQAHDVSFLHDAGGAAYYGGTSGNVDIGGNAYSAKSIAGLYSSNDVDQEHWMQALSLQTKSQGPWNWQALVTDFRYGTDLTRTSNGAYPDAKDGGAGTIADMGGTGWNTVDLNGSWHAPSSKQIVRFGLHTDQFTLRNPTYATDDWIGGDEGAETADSRGRTRTNAVWAQNEWQLSPSLIATLGGRYERWRAYDGYNLSTVNSGGTTTSFAVDQPQVDASGFSPKASLTWQANDAWSVTGSIGKALRFPTVGELYQNVKTGNTYLQANPFLQPERVLSSELALQRITADSRMRISLFDEHVHDALISQTSLIDGSAVPLSFTQNVDRTRQRGIELVGERDNALIRGLDLSGSLTYVDARITANSSYVPTAPGATSVGKHTPYVPTWRATAVATYRPDARWAYTLAARYSSRVYATVDNTDVDTDTYQGFGGYLVADARVNYRFDRHWNLAGGIDNIGNRRYFLYHPFPERTFYAELRYDY